VHIVCISFVIANHVEVCTLLILGKVYTLFKHGEVNLKPLHAAKCIFVGQDLLAAFL
jgi:hypothetical protein